MTYIYKDLGDPCQCALRDDARWFLDHPSRAKFLRLPYECEAALPQEGVSQIVAVWMNVSINDYIKGGTSLVHNVPIHRRSFLYAGGGRARPGPQRRGRRFVHGAGKGVVGRLLRSIYKV